MNPTTKVYADIADRTGILYYNSILLFSQDNQLIAMFKEKVEDTTVVRNLKDLDVDDLRRYDKIIVCAKDYSFDTTAPYLCTLSAHATDVVYCHNIPNAGKKAIEEWVDHIKMTTAGSVSVFKGEGDANFNLLIIK